MMDMTTKLLALAVLQVLTMTLTIGAENLKLLILHNNDMHARFEETALMSGTCKDSDKNINCYGGMARVLHVVKQAREKAAGDDRKVLFLNAGDTYAGTAWYGVHKWKIVADFLNLLNPDAMSLGNHEFDNGVSGLLPLVETTKFPIVAANLNFSKEPLLEASRIQKSVVLEVAGRKIGIVGYLTKDTVFISTPGNVIFDDEVQALVEESRRLNEAGVNIIIALGHSGYKIDQRIAEEVPLVDLVVGGHTNTFLWNGPAPSWETPDDVYPKVVVQKSGKKVPVVQAYAFTKYMGRLNVTFDENGDLIEFHGQPLLLDSSVPQDRAALVLLERFRPEVDLLNFKVVGTSAVYLDGSSRSCRTEECNFGNMITDSFVAYRSSLYPGDYWTDAPIAILNGGDIRNSINATDFNGNVTKGELLGALPFEIQLVTFKLKGSHLWKVMETSVRSNGETSKGEFLQVSGLHVVYDLSKPTGSRVVSIEARCGQCDVPRYKPIQDNETYGIISSAFLTSGGDGYDVLKTNAFDNQIEVLTDLEVVTWFISKRSTVFPEVSGRIKFATAGNAGHAISPLSLLLMTTFLGVLGLVR